MSTLGTKTGSKGQSVKVVFTVPHAPYNAGETAGFDPEIAADLVKRGRARYKSEPKTEASAETPLDEQAVTPPPEEVATSSAVPLSDAAVVDGQIVPRTPPPDAEAPLDEHLIEDSGKLKRKRK